MATLIEDDPMPDRPGRPAFRWRDLLPSPGNALFVLVVAGALLLYVRTAGAGPAGAPAAASTATIPYQGRLADSGGSPLSGSYAMTFKLYNVASNGSALWTETWSGGNSVAVSNGLFNVLLGSLTPVPPSLFSANSSLWLGIAVGGDGEMAPRIQLGSAPFAMRAQNVANGSITTSALADGAVTSRKLDAVEAYSYVDAQETTTGTVPAALLTPDIITFTLETAQWVDISYGATVASSATTYAAYITLYLDGSVLIIESVIEMWSPLPTSIASLYRLQLPAGTHTIQMLYNTHSGGTATYWRRKLLASAISQ